VGVLVEQLAARSVREHLLASLPAKVAEVNATRAAVLMAAVAGPYLISADQKLYVSVTGQDDSPVTVSLTAGAARTAAQVAADVNATPGLVGVGTSDALGRLVLTSTTAPTSGTSYVGVSAGDGAANSVFGWDEGGDGVTRAMLTAPSSKGVADGWPLLNDMGAGFWVIIGDRESVPVSPHPRKDEYIVALELAVFCPVTNEQAHRDREAIHSCIRCVRECLLTDAGLQAGRAASGDVMLISEKAARIPGRPWKMKGADVPNALFDVAAMQLNVRVFERPASS
jgi:hypothetical protein